MAHNSTGAAISKSRLKKHYWANDPVSPTNNFKGNKRDRRTKNIKRDSKICQSIAMHGLYMNPESKKLFKKLTFKTAGHLIIDWILTECWISEY